MSDKNPPSLREMDDPKLEALVEVMFLAAFADGDLGDEERAQFGKSVESLTDRRLSGDALDAHVARMQKGLAEVGREARVAAVKGRLDADARKVAFDLAVQLVAADGIIRTSERELLLELADGLEVDRDHAADVVKGYDKAR
jgi:uncharacterized tellurite resistance protein B-like protein